MENRQKKVPRPGTGGIGERAKSEAKYLVGGGGAVKLKGKTKFLWGTQFSDK